MTARLVCAYALQRYQQPSQTFVENEIRQLRHDGADVRVVAVERGALDRSDDPRVLYLHRFREGAVGLARRHAAVAVRHPRRYARFVRRVVRLRSEMGRGDERLRWWRLPAVAAELDAAGVQVIHAHFGWTGASAAACLAALVDVPWSLTLHANDIFSKRRNLEAKLALADHVVTVCDYNRRWMAEHLETALPSMSVITCGVEVPDGDRPPPDVDIVHAARLVPKKGTDVLLRSVAALAARGVRPSVEIIGDGPLRPELEALAATLGVTELVRFAGDLDHVPTLQRIASARVCCLPCRIAPDGDRDAMPTVIIEAMMRGVAVVSTSVVGIPELLDASCGRVVPPDDVAALTDALAELLGDGTLARQLGDAAAARARDRFRLDTQVGRLREILVGLASA